MAVTQQNDGGVRMRNRGKLGKWDKTGNEEREGKSGRQIVFRRLWRHFALLRALLWRRRQSKVQNTRWKLVTKYLAHYQYHSYTNTEFWILFIHLLIIEKNYLLYLNTTLSRIKCIRSYDTRRKCDLQIYILLHCRMQSTVGKKIYC